MMNRTVAMILNRVADLLEMDGADFRTKAYRRAAHTVEFLPEDIEFVMNEGRLEELPGIGKNIAKKIQEIINTGSLAYYEDLKAMFPVDFEELMSVEGIGPRKIKLFYEKLGVRNLEDLEYAARRHKIQRLKGMGPKTELLILKNVRFARRDTGRKLLGQIMPLGKSLKEEIEKLDTVSKVVVAGSIRRRKETVGDIDLLVVAEDHESVMDHLTGLKVVEEVIAKGPLKSSVRIKGDVEVDLKVFNAESFGAAMVYFTGSKETNVELRRVAISKGLKLNEYGVYRDDTLIAGETEDEVFRALDMDTPEPELRENRGEVDAALRGELPDLVDYTEIRGDLHLHTNWSDGKSKIHEMAKKAVDLGYEYMAVTDHFKSIWMDNGMDERDLEKQLLEIESINEKFEDSMDLCVFSGVEVDIDSEGHLNIESVLLEEIDIVVAALHSGLKQNKYGLTDRIVKVMYNEDVDVLAHPTGRKILEKTGYKLDLERIFQAALDTNTLLEVNADPDRLDLNDVIIREAVDYGCKLVINSNSHSLRDMKNMEMGVATARRGWAESKDIINTLPLKSFKKSLDLN
ncbi:DNA polymerase/3'-5' exonuclease PolX [Methanobacterium congolense]|uniref:DNA polymerase beta n=1 Tax=Methanobacterium congolense TaxID=118062 RepID=A0A1D3L1P2_9EURY|nr:DNA polymerase/3'-5' exonuclease PolX [Methanobacterium congolense]SCG85475.1 DNA polymerase/3'-5' exonuclease PolX [Methanobacterium congolense]